MRTRPALVRRVRPSPPSRVTAMNGEMLDRVGHHRGVGIAALPGQGEREQSRMAGRRLDRVPIAPVTTGAELQRAGPLHRPAPHLDGLVEPPGEDGDRMDPQVAPDLGMVESSPLQDGGRAQRSGREHDHRRADDEATAVGSGGLDTRRATALHEDPGDRGVGHDPGAGGGRTGEVDPDAGLLGPATAAERATAAVAARGSRSAGSVRPPSPRPRRPAR